MNNSKGEKKGGLWSKIGGSSRILYSIIFFFGVLFIGKLILSGIKITSMSVNSIDSILLIIDLVLTYIFFTFIKKK